MARIKTCDRCKRPIERVALKLYMAPTVETANGGRPANRNSDHSNYSAHADIGDCCVSFVVKDFVAWQKRTARRVKAA